MNTATQPFVILLVEDEKTDAHLVKWAMEKTGSWPICTRSLMVARHLNFCVGMAPRSMGTPRPDLTSITISR